MEQTIKSSALRSSPKRLLQALIVLTCFGLLAPVQAEEQSLSVFTGISSKSRFTHNFCCFWLIRTEPDYFAGAAYQRLLSQLPGGFSITGEIGAGSHFGMGTSPQIWGAAFLRYNGFPWDDHLRTTVSFGLGVNYASTVPAAEQRLSAETGTPTSNLFFYLAPEISFSLPSQPNWSVFLRVHHRSGWFPRFTNSKTASNVLLAGLRWTY